MNFTGFNYDFDSKLVDLVRAHPELYASELRTSPYNSMKKKIELWNSVAASMEAETHYCISRWKSLRDRFRRELRTKKSNSKPIKETPWILYDKLNFLTKHIKYQQQGKNNKVKQPHQHNNATWSGMEAESLTDVIFEDDPLQEAMDEQCNYDKERSITVTAPATSTTTLTQPPVSGNLKRIEALLDGLDEANRIKAEKRIVAYLCKCQLKSLSYENVDDIVI